MDALRRSFTSSSSSPDADHYEEAHPILLDHPDPPGDDNGHRPEVILKVDGNSREHDTVGAGDGNGRAVWRGSSYEFWREGSRTNGGGGENCGDGFSFSPRPSPWRGMAEIREDPPRKLISFLRKQRGREGDVWLDMYLEMEELGKPPPTPLTSSSIANSKDVGVSFQETVSAAALRRRSSYSDPPSDSDAGDRDEHGSSRIGAREAEVLKCSANSSFRRNSTLFCPKTRSRLVDPPAHHSGCLNSGDNNRRSPSPRSGHLWSGTLGGNCMQQQQYDDDEDDPFVVEDLPEKYRLAKLDAPTVAQWVSLFVILSAVVCSLTIPVLQRQTVWNLHLWKWELLVFALICGRLVSGWIIRFAVFFFERNFILRKRVLYFVYGLRRAVQNCLWLGLVVIAWHCIFGKKVERETNSMAPLYVTKVLVCLLLTNLMWLVKTLLVKVLASSFHVSTYFDRIQESLFNQYVIETLSGPPLIKIQQLRQLEGEEQVYMAELVHKFQNSGARFSPELKATSVMPNMQGGAAGRSTPMASPVGKNGRLSGRPVAGKECGRGQQEEGITIEHLHRLNQKNVSAWNMKRLMNIVRHGCLSTLDENIPADASGEDDSTNHIRSECEAKIAAKKIFTNVAKPGSKYMYLTDLMRFMPEDEALKTMGLFEGAQDNKRVGKYSLKNWVVNAFRERRALSLTLCDTKTAVNRLHRMVNVVVSIAAFVIWLIILGIATKHLLVLVGSQILLVVFIFGNTCKMIFEAIIFLFVIHPFDVGDRCEVDGVQVVVEEMNILTTVFLRHDNQKVTYPNNVLWTKPIGNYYRSPDMWDDIVFRVHTATPVEKLAIMKERIKSYIEGRKEHWYPNAVVVCKDVDELDTLKVSIWLQHTMNYQDIEERWVRRDLVVQEALRVVKELDIDCRSVVVPPPSYVDVGRMSTPSKQLSQCLGT